MTCPRRDIYDPADPAFFHCIARCVRRAFLCGFDRLSKRSYEHRKQWIQNRLRDLLSIFSVECLAFSVMGNHLHTVLHNRPDLSQGWSAEEVARRWLRVFPKRRDSNNNPAEPTTEEILQITSFPDRVAMLRGRLCDISWFNRCLNENIARRANSEDHCTGRFWEGRFKCQRLDSQAAVIACCAYVDLNEVTAGICDIPERSNYSSIKQRVQALRGEFSPCLPPLAEFENCLERTLSLSEYVQLVDETGRAIKEGKKSISSELAPILERLGIRPEGWMTNAVSQESIFRRVLAPVERLKSLAKKRGKSWFQGIKTARLVFI